MTANPAYIFIQLFRFGVCNHCRRWNTGKFRHISRCLRIIDRRVQGANENVFATDRSLDGTLPNYLSRSVFIPWCASMNSRSEIRSLFRGEWSIVKRFGHWLYQLSGYKLGSTILSTFSFTRWLSVMYQVLCGPACCRWMLTLGDSFNGPQLSMTFLSLYVSGQSEKNTSKISV